MNCGWSTEQRKTHAHKLPVTECQWVSIAQDARCNLADDQDVVSPVILPPWLTLKNSNSICKSRCCVGRAVVAPDQLDALLAPTCEVRSDIDLIGSENIDGERLRINSYARPGRPSNRDQHKCWIKGYRGKRIHRRTTRAFRGAISHHGYARQKASEASAQILRMRLSVHVLSLSNSADQAGHAHGSEGQCGTSTASTTRLRKGDRGERHLQLASHGHVCVSMYSLRHIQASGSGASEASM
ncbi:hypothetical protein BLA3211_01543 [Burkholderia aenigmatica]|uniref:Uncharacterized protein n=1 Tax=Burkholderia aenigmatica TaxID=2015348 RepID=A0A6J5IQW1_9BURK|nr:hypothetical protein BLA3211_01543 [Burkholderia aenigmatica]